VHVRHNGELVFGQKQKLDVLVSPMIYTLPVVPERPRGAHAHLPPL
jgi:hypothetical protein